MLYCKKIILLLLIAMALFATACGSTDGEHGKKGAKTDSSTHSQQDDTPKQPEQPETPKTPEQPETPKQPEQPETPKTPEQPETPKIVREECTEAYINSAQITGRFYQLPETTGMTDYRQENPEDVTQHKGLENRKVTLVLPGGKTRETYTCPDGTYAFKDVSSNMGVIDFGSEDCTTHNCPTNLAKKLAQPWADENTPPTIKVLTFGDSIASYPHGAKWFPQHFKELVPSIATIQNDDVAIPGTETKDWLPGTKHFNERILNYEDPDVIVISISGNDVLHKYPDILFKVLAANKMKLINKIPEVADTAIANIKTIIDKLRELFPKADIVWLSYLDYAHSFGSIGVLVGYPKEKAALIQNLRAATEKEIQEIAGYKGTFLLDINGYTKQHPQANGKPFDNGKILIWDGIHLNQDGHELYGQLLFRLLGGFIIDKDLGTHRYVGFAN